jgi:hypothetical protein
MLSMDINVVAVERSMQQQMFRNQSNSACILRAAHESDGLGFPSSETAA